MKACSDSESQPESGSSPADRGFSRRRFLQALGALGLGLLIPGCPAKPAPGPSPSPTATAGSTLFPTLTSTSIPTATPTFPPSPTATPPPTSTPVPSPTPTAPPTPTTPPSPTPTVPPTSTPVPLPTATPTPPALSRVAIAQAGGYDRQLVRQQVQALLDGLGGLGDLIRPGARVAIKPNLTGGTGISPLPGVAPVESYITHPEVVRALGELLRDAGAGQLYIVEGVFDTTSYPAWGYEEVAAALGATLIDLNSPHPYSDFVSVSLWEGWNVYQAYTVNRILQEVDVFVSVAKMKCHWSCGLTLSLKNQIGLVPVSHYRCHPDDWIRSDLHACGGDFSTRLPGSVVDLARVRPIHLAVIDGVKTVEAGEGPWVQTIASVQPGLLVAGKNPVATDAVCAALMGFDPTAAYPSTPFLRSENHLSLASAKGVGPHRLDQIEVVGAAIDDVRYGFKPA